MGLSMIRDFLDSILAWVNTPWRAAVAVLMLVLGGVAWATWSERGLLIRAVEQWLYGPELNAEAAEAGAKRLLVHADLVALYEVDLAANWKRTLYVFDRDGEITALEGMEMPFVPRSVDSGVVFETLSGQTVCTQLDLGVYLGRTGYSYACGQPIPHGTGLTVGTIHLAWRAPPSPEAEGRARVAMQRAADQLVRW
jgi:hypothetical protein